MVRNLLLPLKSQRGFTLIELLAVIIVTGVVLVLVSAIFVQIVQSNVKATVSNDIRENGQFMIEQVVRAIRNADSVTPGVKVGDKTLTLTVSSAGVVNIYKFECLNGDTARQSMTRNGQQLNTTKILVNVSCDSSGATIEADKSWFEMVPPFAGAPAAVQINLSLETTGTQLHREYVGKQTLTQLVTLRTYAR